MSTKSFWCVCVSVNISAFLFLNNLEKLTKNYNPKMKMFSFQKIITLENFNPHWTLKWYWTKITFFRHNMINKIFWLFCLNNEYLKFSCFPSLILKKNLDKIIIIRLKSWNSKAKFLLHYSYLYKKIELKYFKSV